MTTAFDIATLSAVVNRSTTSTNASEIIGGTAGSLLYQSAPNTTDYVSIGATGYVLQSNGTTPVWVSTSTLGIGGGGAGGGYTGSIGYSGSVGYTGSSGAASTVPGYAGSVGYTGSAGPTAVATPTSLGAVFGYTTGNGNTFIGCCAGNASTSGANNTAVGSGSFSSNTTGVGNTAVGNTALFCNTSGLCNTAVGANALGTNTLGSCNTAVGWWAMACNTTGGGNTSIGRSSLGQNTTGVNNIGIGFCAGCSITTGVNNTVIGSLPAAAGCVCTLLIGAGTCERIKVDNSGLYINGTVFTGGGFTSTDDVATNATYYPVFATTAGGSTAKTASTKLQFNPNNGTLYATVFQSLSDQKLKTNIQSINDPAAIIESLKGVKFDWVHQTGTQYGFIAQEVEKIVPELVDTTGIYKTVNYQGIIPFLVETVKLQQLQIHQLTSRLEKLEGR